MIKIFSSLEEAVRAVPIGKIRLLIINNKKIGLVHTKMGFRAFDNACQHQHEPLHKGLITPYGEVVCPLHHYRYNLETGQEAENRCNAMHIYAVKTNRHGLFIEI